MTHETPVPFHPDLRAKKVDSFLKKFLRRKGANFNTALDRRHLNLAGRILDPLGPLAGLWQIALSAEADNTGVDPSLVIDFVRRTMSLVGNASHCALTDRRKALLAKVSAECLDLVDDQALFVPGTSDMFGKKHRRPKNVAINFVHCKRRRQRIVYIYSIHKVGNLISPDEHMTFVKHKIHRSWN